MRLTNEKFYGMWKEIPTTLLLQLDRMFGRVFDRSDLIPWQVREFVNASAGAVSRYLPDGTKSPDKDYFYLKTDVSANAVTIYPFGTQTINGAASYALAAQYNRVLLGWDYTTNEWKVIHA